MVELITILYMTILGMTMVFLFMESKYSRKITAITVYGTMLLELLTILLVYQFFGLYWLTRVYTLLTHLPSLVLFICLSRYRGWKMVFQLFSAVLFCMLLLHSMALPYYLFDNQVWILLISCPILTVIVLQILRHYLLPLSKVAMQELHQGWWLMCLVMILYYLIVVYLIPELIGTSLIRNILKPAISLMIGGFYAIIMMFFSTIKQESEARHSAQLSNLQLSALQSRMEAVKAAEDIVRIQRHDLRHRLQTVSELVARGDKESALVFLDAAEKRLDDQKEIRWCHPPVLDAVFSSYFDQAQRQNIMVDAKISLSNKLPVDEGELAIVLANALENAIHANMELPHAQRELHCKMVGTPSIMLEISNPCADTVPFDEFGFPIAQREGHGLGMQSISSFCKKYDAVCQFTQQNGWFYLRLIL